MTEIDPVAFGQMREAVSRIDKRLEGVEVQVRDIHNQANRWRGGFVVVMGLGGIVTWLLSWLEPVRHFFGK